VLTRKTITGVRWDDNHFTTIVPFQWVLDNHISGLALEDAMRDLAEGKAVDPRAEQLGPLGERLQRPFKRFEVVRRRVGVESTPVL
jgi:hypothetical protein